MKIKKIIKGLLLPFYIIREIPYGLIIIVALLISRNFITLLILGLLIPLCESEIVPSISKHLEEDEE